MARSNPLFVGVLSGIVLAQTPMVVGNAQQNEKPTLVPQPSTLTEFSADYISVTVSPKSKETTVGRFFRASSGANRLESGPLGGGITSISVRRPTDGAIYQWVKGKGLLIHPAPAPPHGWGPPPRLSSGLQFLKRKVEGLDVVRNDQVGGYSLEALQLNLWPIFMRICAEDACTEERYYNIKIGPQPAELFEVPHPES